MANVAFKSSADSSLRCIVEKHVQCMQSPMHLAESATPSANSWFHSYVKFRGMDPNFLGSPLLMHTKFDLE